MTTPLRTTPVLLVVAVLLVAGCGSEPETTTITDPPPPPDELGQYGEPCPPRLVTEPAVQPPAEELPDLIAADEGWACSYELDRSKWRRTGDPVPLQQEQLEAAQAELEELEPAPADQVCPMDLGPRYVLVMSSGGDLTSVVIDDYGCHTVRLGDNLYKNAPGEGDVPGLFSLPNGLVEDLKQIAG